MTRRIRDFMTNTNTVDLSSTTNDQNQDISQSSFSDFNRNFGVPLDKCEPSSISPVCNPYHDLSLEILY